jgi:hypothetical protein
VSGAERQTRDRHATRRACLRTSRRKLARLISSREERAKARSSGTVNSRPRCNRGACLRRGSLHQRRNEEERRALPLLRKVNQHCKSTFDYTRSSREINLLVEPNKVFCSDTQVDDLWAALSTANMLTPNWHTWHTNIHGSDIQDAPALACSNQLWHVQRRCNGWPRSIMSTRNATERLPCSLSMRPADWFEFSRQMGRLFICTR